MKGPAYPAARAVAPAIEANFARLHAAADESSPIGPLPDARAIEAMINTGFWASLRHEEGRSPKISLAFLPIEQAGDPLALERRLPLTPETLTRFAPAVERPGIHLGVWHDEEGHYVWGASRTVPALSLVVEVVEPGLLVIKYSRGESFGKYGNIAVLQGEDIKIVDEQSVRDPDWPSILAPLVGLDPSVTWLNASNLLVQLGLSMRAHQHGGTLLIVPTANRSWQDSLVRPISYRVEPAFRRLSDVAQQDPSEWNSARWQNAFRSVVDGVAGLTAVDGATVMSDRYELLAFGAKILLSDGSDSVKQILVREPVVDSTSQLVEAAWIGGTRHLSAAQFVYDQRDAHAFVASQDGRFTIFMWSDVDELVHAYRIETLML